MAEEVKRIRAKIYARLAPEREYSKIASFVTVQPPDEDGVNFIYHGLYFFYF